MVTFIASAATFQPQFVNVAGAGTYCQGATATALTANYFQCSTTGGAPVGSMASVTWYYNLTNSTVIGTAVAVSGPTTFTSTPATTGALTYTPSTATPGTRYYFCVIARLVAGCAGPMGSTISSSTQLVTVNAVPGPISGTTTICSGTTTTFTNSLPGGAWSSSAAGVASVGASTGVVSGNSGGSATITYNVSGCIATRGITVNASPAAFTVTGGGAYCPGGSNIPVGLSGSSAGVDYQLYNGATSVGSAVTGTGAALSFGTFSTAATYTVMATNATSGCTAPMTGSATVTVATPVVPSVSILSGATGAVCEGTITTFTANAVNGGTTPAYIWTVNGTTVGGSGTYSYMPANGDIIRVLLTAGGICASPDTASAATTAVIIANQLPAVTVAVTPGTHVCLGSIVSFSATPSFGGSAPTYKWNKNGINVATGPAYSYAPLNGDIIYCQLKSTYPCRLADSVVSSNVSMLVETPVPAPVVSIVANPGLSITAGQADTLIAIAAGGSAAPLYQWYVNGTAVAGATTAVFVSSGFANGDVVACRVTNTDFCAKVSAKSVTISVSSSVGNIAGNDVNIVIVPNPNKGSFSIKGSVADENVSLVITDVLGRAVFTERYFAAGGMLDHNVHLAGTLPAGVYLLAVRTSAQNKLAYFVVE